MPTTFKQRIPIRSLIDVVLKKNKNKVFYANEIFDKILKINNKASYQALVSALKNYDSITVYGDKHRKIYGHKSVLKKVQRASKSSLIENKYVNSSSEMLVLKMFELNKKKLYTPSELFNDLKKKNLSSSVTYGSLKRSMHMYFPRITLSSRKRGYYGHTSILNKYEKYLKQNNMTYKYIKPREAERQCQI